MISEIFRPPPTPIQALKKQLQYPLNVLISMHIYSTAYSSKGAGIIQITI